MDGSLHDFARDYPFRPDDEDYLVHITTGTHVQQICLDPFDRVQLAYVVRVCRESATLSEAGRKLYAATREHRKVQNDADRLRKYLARFGLDWRTCKG